MSDDEKSGGGLREQTAKAIRFHEFDPVYATPGRGCCAYTPDGYVCDWKGKQSDHAEHVADAVIKALGLTEEWGVVGADEGHAWPDEEADSHEDAEALAAERCQSCDSCRNAFPKDVVRRWVSGWSVVGGER